MRNYNIKTNTDRGNKKKGGYLLPPLNLLNPEEGGKILQNACFCNIENDFNKLF